MEERLLFHWIALQRADIADRHLQYTILVEAYFADPRPPRWNLAAVPTGITMDPVISEPVIKLTGLRELCQQITQRLGLARLRAFGSRHDAILLAMVRHFYLSYLGCSGPARSLISTILRVDP